MTVEVQDTFTIKTKRTEHPNAGKYPGRPSMEFGTGLRQFMSDIGMNNLDAFSKGSFVFEEEITAEFFDSIIPGDVVGLGILNGFNEAGENQKKEPCAYKFLILSVDKNTDTMQARNVTYEQLIKKRSRKGHESDYKGTEVELTFEEVSCAFGMGFGEILERDGKPYGVSEEVELKVKVFGKKDDTVGPNATGATNVLPENASVTEESTSVGSEVSSPAPIASKPKRSKAKKSTK
jgi:hypothetical protein